MDGPGESEITEHEALPTISGVLEQHIRWFEVAVQKAIVVQR